MNQLLERFDAGLVVLAFPCNQFGHQENSSGEEILNSLRYVRPGNNFESKAEIFSKIDVNGTTTHPVFQFLKEKLPLPSDDCVSLIDDPKFIIWSPVRRSDIGWNFEKFLIDKKGTPVMRYSKSFETIKIADDIHKLL